MPAETRLGTVNGRSYDFHVKMIALRKSYLYMQFLYFIHKMNYDIT